MQLIQQLLAAMLNVEAFGADPGTLITDAKGVYCNTLSTRAQILAQASALAAFNEAGAGIPLPPGLNQGKADPKAAQAAALKSCWDVLP